ncbi:GGDEF domain-containing phosphodiesterase [Ruminococcus sp. NK3A76]|uniref:GGDEF domain-containing phosphodiesterase n=1 Tax=Ruminococcus sp. NK3A76 TaxID=877411 RepID=UPI00068E4409|nr:GGDEF domain-containing phosphodiesterase [Ruminococcus sp. NK3A76]
MENFRFTDAEIIMMESSGIPFAFYQFVDKRVVTLLLSRGFRDMFGYEDKAQAYYDMDNDMYKDVHPDDAARIADAAVRFATEGGKYDVIYRSKSPDGDGYNIIHAQGEHFYTNTGVKLAQVWYINEGKHNENESSDGQLSRSLNKALHDDSFQRATVYDHLTGLPSMTYFFELATSKKTEMLSRDGHPALLYMDFAGMKYFNHKHGFTEGDKLLQAFARTIAAEFGNENCCRLGQDHFAVITTGDDLEATLERLFEKCKTINEGRSLPVHVGVFLHWYEGIVASTACDRAKFACDTLTNNLSSGYGFYNMSMMDAEEKQQYIIANLDRAISEGWIKVYYQPIVRAVNGRVCDEEALARWIDPLKGFMSPADFIPVLEEHNLIYKLDLYVVDCVLKKIRVIEEAGLNLMPQSVNLSRSDFDCCDMVEEIRRRVDDAGISRSLLTIEITESTLGQDFEFIKAQVERFRELGFAVWMDDFGSGYSSLDVLQSVRFDLIKFDMHFMRQFDEGNNAKVILTELLKMATSLGIDTICEGVETAEQVQFLQETGCLKLQGFYFDRPIPVEKIIEKYAKGMQIGFENPDESSYYEAIGRVNLHDLAVITQENLGEFDNIFNTLPMGIIETHNGQVRFARTNQTYRDFMLRNFGLKVTDKPEPFFNTPGALASPFMKGLLQSSQYDGLLYIDETMPDGSLAHSCMRRLAVNPVTGTTATAVVVLSVSNAEQGITYANIARALAADYFNLFYVNIETERFIEYTSAAGYDELAVERHGENFFEQSRIDAVKYIHSEDSESFVNAFTKENVLRMIDEQGQFMTTYRLVSTADPLYVQMKGMRMPHDPKHIIIGVSNIDMQMKQKLKLEHAHRNEMVFSRIMALSGDYICIYFVDIVSGDYIEYNAANAYSSLGFAKEGKDFFEQSRTDGKTVMLPDEYERFFSSFSKEKIFEAIRKNGQFVLSYHLLIDGEQIPVELKAALVREGNADKLIVGVYKQR